MGEGWCDNPSGSRPNFFGRQHLTFDKGGKCGGAKQGIVRVWEVMRGEGVCDNNIKKRSQHITVTAYLLIIALFIPAVLLILAEH